MKKGEIKNTLVRIRAELIKLENRMENVRGIDLSKVEAELDKAGTHITAALRELENT